MRCIKAATKHQGMSFPDRRDGGGIKDQPADAAQASQAHKINLMIQKCHKYQCSHLGFSQEYLTISLCYGFISLSIRSCLIACSLTFDIRTRKCIPRAAD